MKKILKRTFWGLGIFLVLVALVVGGFVVKLKAQITVVETGIVAPGIFAVKNTYVNMYLMKDSDTYIAFDAGNDVEAVANELKVLNINPDKVTALFLTHSDGDHVGGLKLFKNATVYLSRDEEPLITEKFKRKMGRFNQINTKIYTLLDDQQTVLIGNLKVTGISTPGHTPGSMSFLVNNKFLFVGDAFGVENGKIIKPNAFFTEDMETAVKSFEKIKNLPEAESIFTGHTGISLDYKNAVKTKFFVK